MSSEDISAIIIDSGGDSTKAGFGKDEYPHSIFPTLVARSQAVGLERIDKFVYVGQKIIETQRRLKTVNCPVEHGLITNWDDIEHVWHHAFYNELRVEPEEHPVLITESPLNPKANREKTTQIMFETFNTPALYISTSAVLSLYGAGRTTGIVLGSGHTVSHTAPVLSGCLLSHATQRLPLAGAQLTGYLAACLSRHSCPEETVRHIKEKLTYVSLSSKHDTSLVTADNYKLPDGTVISLGSSELSRCPEALFQPSLLPSSEPPVPSQGAHQSICSSVDKCDIGIRRHLYANIVLSGGSTLFPGMKDRLERELSLLCPLPTKVRVIAPAERKYLAWIGGANLTSLSTFNKMWVSKDEYDESGPMIIRRRVF